MGYALFIVLNAVLFIRPEEMWPELAESRLYLIVMVLCILVNLPRLAVVLSPGALAANPVGVCVLGLLLAVPLSNLMRGNTDLAVDNAGEFGKVVLYYFLMTAVLDTPGRFRGFLGWCVVLISVLTAVALLQFHEYIDIEQMRPIAQGITDEETGDVTYTYRIRSTGIFNDPNDLCLVLVFGGLCCAYRAVTCGSVPVGVLWVLPVAAFGYTLTLTQSRGGLLGLLAGLVGILFTRLSRARAVMLALVCLPAVVLGAGGRQADISLSRGDTGNQRVMLWAEGLTEMQNRLTYLLTGIGAEEYENEFGYVAHNSYIHAYVELGLFGGTAFLATFVWAGVMLRRVSRGDSNPGPVLLRAWPFVVAMLCAYAVGIFSLSRNYVIPTYMMLGLVTCYLNMTRPMPTPNCFTRVWLQRTAGIGLTGFVILRLFTMIAGRLG
ncbi:MAG TPA: O-antigen ligase family protein [Fimbriiglobus sp.]|nr:O-antigen ligase family protein [Fimbriiglobus sp.]